jgi:ribonuclease HI
MTLIKTGISYLPLSDAPLHPQDDTTEWIGVRINIKRKQFDLHNIYIPPIRTGVNDDRVQRFDPTFLPTGQSTIIAGDLNAHHFLWDDNSDEDTLGTLIADWCANADWTAANSGQPTFMHRGVGPSVAAPSAPDVSLGHQRLLQRSTWQTLQDSGSDHLPCLLIIHTTRTDHQQSPPKWNYKKADWDSFKADAENVATNWYKNKTVHSKCKRFHEVILEAARTNIPFGSRKGAKCWWSEETELAVIDRRIARATAEYSGTPEDRAAWNLANSNTKKVILDAKKAEWQEFTSNLSSTTDSAKIHQVFKSINNSPHPPMNNEALQFQTDGGIIKTLYSDKEKADAFVGEYARVNHLKRDPVRDKEVKSELASFKGPCSRCDDNKTDSCQPFTMPELKRAIWTLKANKSPGPDGVSNDMLKHLGPRARAALLDLINHSWSSGIVPASFKLSHIVPVAKRGKPPGLIGSYRPIALMSCIAKLMEKMIARRLVFWLETNNLLSQEQAGFRACRSTEDQVARIVQTVSNGFQARPAKRFTLTLFDFSRAFDRVWRKGLLLKLYRLGAGACLIKWLSNFLSGRQCRVRFNFTLSRFRVFRDGLPQGSGLAPILFIIFIDDIVAELARIPNTATSLFADDLASLAMGTSLDLAQKNAQLTANCISSWAKRWKCVIAPDKTEFCALSTAPMDVQRAANLTITVCDKVIASSSNPCFLGVTFDRLLHFNQHVDKKVKAAKFKLRQLRALAGTNWGCNFASLRGLYMAHIRAGLEYAGGAWLQSLGPSGMDKLERVQREAARTITGCTRSTPIGALLQEAHLVPIAVRGDLLAATLREKALRNHPNHPCRLLCERDVRTRLKSVRGWQTKAKELATAAGLDHLPRLPLRIAGSDPPWTSVPLVFHLDASAVSRSAPAEARRSAAEQVLSRLPPLLACAWTDGSVGEGGSLAGAGAFVDWSTGEPAELLEAAGAIGSSFSAEAVALRLALTHVADRLLDKDLGPSLPAVAFCTDSLSVLLRLKGHPGREDSAVLDEIRVLARRLSRKVAVHLVWVPGHAGVPGNERVDALAKDAANLPQAESPIPLACAKARLRALSVQSWRDGLRRDWHYSATGGRPPKVDASLSRLEARTLAQLRTGHCHLLKAYQHRIGVADDPTCPNCGDGPEDANHLLATCAAWAVQRQESFGSEDEVTPRSVLRFLRKTGYL